MLKLPKMNNLAPTLDSTVYKLVEESGELARAVLIFHANHDISRNEQLLADVVGELFDVAQTCVTMIFVFEEVFTVDISELVAQHLLKLSKKGYLFDENQDYRVETDGCCKYLNFPRLYVNADIIQTLCKIQEELGELAQYIGKHGGASGENVKMNQHDVIVGAAAELCDVAQCCFTMLHILKEKQSIDIETAQKRHIAKLVDKGYLNQNI